MLLRMNHLEPSIKPSSSVSVLSFSRKKMKARAPPPPGKPTAQNVHSDQKLPHDSTLGSQHGLVQMKEALQNSTLDITVVLPSGLEKQSVVSGR